MATLPIEDIAPQFSKANDAITAATGRAPTLYRPAGGLSTDPVRQSAATFGLAEILWDVIPFDWANDTNTAATRQLLMSQIKPGSVVLFHDTTRAPSTCVPIHPVLKANGYRMVTVSELLGPERPAALRQPETVHPSTNFTTSRQRDPTLPNTPRPSRCPISRSPTFRPEFRRPNNGA